MTNKKTGYLTASSKGKYKYVQLRRSVSVKNETTGDRVVKKELLFSFGNYETSLENMRFWRENPAEFPEKLKKLGYDLNDLDDWILTLETKVTKTGRKFNI